MRLYINFVLILLGTIQGCQSGNKQVVHTGVELQDSTIKISVIPLKNFKQDTLEYLKENFVINKQSYINKPFKVLLDSLKLPIFKYYNGVPSYDSRTDDVPAIYLNIFSDVPEKMKNGTNPGILLISFNRLIPADSAYGLIKVTHLKWKRDAVKFYQNRLVKNIQMAGSDKKK
ncbi:hypothetical protein ABIB40_003405 [Pedobacter sp. UYP30]|uniref:hypothetical protein n=1 Tax=Pedobacter sp. UYP30 TaxID=1756400 RepID=UPI0033995A57